eukprot:68170-Prorocentrum_minimum.AAC.1
MHTPKSSQCQESDGIMPCSPLARRRVALWVVHEPESRHAIKWVETTLNHQRPVCPMSVAPHPEEIYEPLVIECGLGTRRHTDSGAVAQWERTSNLSGRQRNTDGDTQAATHRQCRSAAVAAHLELVRVPADDECAVQLLAGGGVGGPRGGSGPVHHVLGPDGGPGDVVVADWLLAPLQLLPAGGTERAEEGASTSATGREFHIFPVESCILWREFKPREAFG